MREQLLTLAVMLYITAPACTGYAHPSPPYFYDECSSITIEGRVERVEFRDPHSWIVLVLDDGSTYTVDWAPLSRLINQGVIGPAKQALVFGARVVVTGNRTRPTAQIREHFPDFTSEVNSNTVDPSSIRRVGDGFSWALPTRTAPPNCGRG